MPGILRKIRTAVSVALASGALMTAAGLLTPSAPAAHAATLTAATVTACKTTNEYQATTSHSASAGTTVKQEWIKKIACGRAYQEWETVRSRSTDGAHYTETVYRDERGYPHYWQDTVKRAWSKTGAYKYTSTVVTG
jgi:hypothetical protein